MPHTSPGVAPGQPCRLKSRFEIDGPRLTVSYHGIDPTGFFLLLWLIGWTVGCIGLTGSALRQPSAALLAIPFWAAWVLSLCIMLNCFFRSESFELGPEGIRFVRRVIVVVKRTAIPLEEIQGFGSYEKVVDSESEIRRRGVEVRTQGQGLQFGQGLPEAERLWLVHQLNEQLARLKPDGGRREAEADPARESPVAAAGDPASVPERLVPGPTPLAPPSDARWKRWDRSPDIAFAMRGRLSWCAVGVLLFINAFWNGILSVFLSHLFLDASRPQGGEWWGHFAFLVPFAIIGLAMVLALLIVLCEPFRRTCWTFSHGSVERHSTWFGIGPRRSYPVDALDRIELRRREQGSPVYHPVDEQRRVEKRVFLLVFIDRRNVESLSIGDLTEGEARWMADVVLRHCHWWFK